MINTSPTTLHDLLAVLTNLQGERDELLQQYQGRLQELERRIEAVRLTIDVLANREGTGSPREERPANLAVLGISKTDWTEKLKGKTQAQALIEIAQENDGMLKVTDARDILVAAGLAKGKAVHVRGHLYRHLGESLDFERFEPGIYRLRGQRSAPLFQAA